MIISKKRIFILFCFFCTYIIFLNISCLHARIFNGQECVPDEILVKFKKTVSESELSHILKKNGALSYTASYKNRFKFVKVTESLFPAVLETLCSHPAIEYAEPNYILKACFIPDDEYYDYQWHLQMINVEDAWDLSTGDGVTVAVVDTGVNPNGHDGFGGRLLAGYNAILNIPYRYEDDNGHGTHVAGTIAQATDNSRGVAGIAFDADILPVKVLNRLGFGNSGNTAEGISWAADHGADIINMSLGGSNPVAPVEEAIRDAVSAGVTIVAATGNDSGPVGYPAAYEDVIAVGAVDAQEQLAYYSNTGPEVDVVAPGGDVNADTNMDGYADGVLQETFHLRRGFSRFALGWNYYFFMGTSMATPHVAGIAALIKSRHPEYGPDEIREALISTATDLGSSGRDDLYGHGLVDAYAPLVWGAGSIVPGVPKEPGGNDDPDEPPDTGDDQFKVNFFNNLVYSSGKHLTATLKTSEGSWEAETGEYSDCRAVDSSICDLKLYVDGDYYGSFSGCLDIINECGSDATILLDYSSDVTLYLLCHDQCGDDILDVNALNGAAAIIQSQAVTAPGLSAGAFSRSTDFSID